MRTAVIGAGAMGCLLGGFLAKSKEEVWLVDLWKEHIQSIRKNGLTISIRGKKETVPVQATTQATDAGTCDLVIISTKFHDTGAAVQSALPLVHKETVVMTVQNGIGHVEKISEFIGKKQILFGLTTLGSLIKCPGVIEVTFLEGAATYLWPLLGKPNDRAEAVVEAFNRSGLEFQLTADVRERIWKKLCLNAGFSVLTAIPRLKCGDFIEEPPALDLVRGLVYEIAAVARKEGVDIDPQSACQYVFDMGKQAPQHLTSALVDVLNQRKTEIDCLNGAIVAKAREHGLEVPYNRAIFNLITIIENTYRKSIGKL